MRKKWNQHEYYHVFDKVVKLCKLTRKSVKVVCAEYNLSYAELVIFLADFPICNNELEIFNYELDEMSIGKAAENALIWSLFPRTIPLRKTEKFTDKDGNEIVKVTLQEKFIAPNTTLTKFALTKLKKITYGAELGELTQGDNGVWELGY